MAFIPFDSSKKFVCVEYPGIVKNTDKLLQTLGGIETISKTHADSSRRLELRLRPNDVYCKPACADRCSTNNVLLRVRRKKPKPGSDSDLGSNDPLQCAIVGVVDTTYKFKSMCDFQYLPATSILKRVLPTDSFSHSALEAAERREWKSLTSELVVDKIENSTWLEKPSPLFLPPPIFSRQDTPVEYLYRPEPKHRNPKTKQDSRAGSSSTAPKAPWNDVDGKDLSASKEHVTPHTNLIGVARQRRAAYTIFVNFDDPEVPQRPIPEAEKAAATRIHDERDKRRLEDIRRLFNERPIWSKNALKCKVDVAPDKLKLILPVVAYFFITGPWRSLWVRLGYDPRQDPASKMYQLVDFRIRQRSAADKICIRSKRSTYSYNLPNTVQKAQPPVVRIFQEDLELKSSDRDASSSPVKDDEVKKKSDSIYVFRKGTLPPFRQMFYQLCDIEDEEVQQLLTINEGKEMERGCTEKDGWCLEGMQDKARDIISQRLKETLMETTGEDAGETAEGSSSKPALVESKMISTGKVKRSKSSKEDLLDRTGDDDDAAEMDYGDLDQSSERETAMEEDDDEWLPGRV